MKKIISCIKKDRLEYIRSHKSLLCVGMLLLCACMVLLATASLPTLLSKIMEGNSFLSEETSLTSFMEKFFPSDIRSSMGIFASDIGVFYGLLVIFLTYNLVPDEIQTGKIILPLCAGHSKRHMLVSKLIVYGGLMALPVFPIYMVYYMIGSGFLENNYSLLDAARSGLLMAFAIYSVINLTISLSVIFRKKFTSLAIMVGIILVAPDALSFFSFARYLPTYILTFLYKSSTDYKTVIFPLTIIIGLMIILNSYALLSKLKISFDDRR